MKLFVKQILLFFSVVLLLSCKTSINEEKKIQENPNIILIIADDMNGYAIKNQYPLIKTPNLNKLLSEGILFENAACNSPVCNPSRSSFFSGLYPHTTGAYMNGSDGWNRSEILKTIKSIPEHFKEQGYETWGAGKLYHNEIEPKRDKRTWDNYPVYQGGFGPFPGKDYWKGGSNFFSIKPWEGSDFDFPDVKNAKAAAEFLNKKHDKPFLMVYGLWRPHSPYTAPKRFFEQYEGVDFPLPKGYKENDFADVPFLGQMLVDSLSKFRENKELSIPLWKKFLKAYAANYSFADDNIGKVINALDKSNYAKNTIVIFYSDNGFHNGEKMRWGKATLWEQADYVPFIIRTPDKKRAICKATISLIDIFPTLVDYAGIKVPAHALDGNSLVPLIKNPNLKWSHPSFTSYGENYSSVRNERYRYLSYPDGTEEMYDLQNDPYEWKNIVNDKNVETIKDKLKREIPKKWAPTLGGRLEVPRDYKKVMRPEMLKAAKAKGS
ncbi:sulfatase [Flavobacterium sp. ARAG 55.4]|uniref:sulfatase n=1 Tax=Flavobacterium sp. ARAG 55.4 TaxID=3451357 RepID=UPI003F477195